MIRLRKMCHEALRELTDPVICTSFKLYPLPHRCLGTTSKAHHPPPPPSVSPSASRLTTVEEVKTMTLRKPRSFQQEEQGDS